MNPRAWLMALAALAALPADACAQDWPLRPVRILVPYLPGGGADTLARSIGTRLAEMWGRPVVIDNRPGGATNIGTDIVAKSPPDGHTLLVVFPSFIVNPSVRSKMPFDPLKDFRAVGQTLSVPMVIAVHPSIPATTLAELVAHAKAKPGTLSYGTPGTATTHHVMGEMLKQAARIDITHAPFQGGGPALTALQGGHIPMIYANVSEVAPHAKSGKLRPIVVTTAERAEALPDTPSMREAGFPDLVGANWSGLVVPAATPAPAVARLNAELQKALAQGEVAEKFKTYGMVPAPGTAEAFNAFLASEHARYGKVVREAGIKAD